MNFFRSVLIGALCAVFVAPAWGAAGDSKNCGGVGQKECNGSYYVCRNNADCVKGKLPSYATAGHCVSAGRSGYNVCTATACSDDYELKSGYCQKKKTVAATPTTKISSTAISGTVIDSETGEPVLYATIALMQNDGVTMVADDTGCVADDEGKFSASFKDVPQDAKMRVSATGYEQQFVALGQNLEIKLKPITFATESNAGGQTIEDIAEPETNTIADAEQAYADAKDKEQSTANKMLGGLSMAATGIGAMQMAQGLSEQSADADAARDMDAYLATMQCRVGDNVYKLGDAGIDVGGTNQLTELYQQYVDLAADLKERKTALGMKSGIESQVVMDSAKMGLYDDKGNGIENGTYASLYRASRGNEKDKKAFDDAKDTSRNRVKYGTIAAGVGVVGGVIGNELINGDDDDDDDDDVSNVKDKYTINLKKSGVNDRDVTYNFDLTRNGISNLGYNLDGRCARDINDNRTGGCDNLTTRGTWWTSFSYGTVYGEARCGTKAEHPNQNKTNMTIPCFCKITSVDRNNIKDTKWVYFTDFNDDNHCRNSCATNCSSYLSTNEELRKKSLGVILKRLDKKSNGGIDLSGISAGLGNNLGQAAGAISGVIGGVSNDGGGMNMGQAASLIQSLGK